MARSNFPENYVVFQVDGDEAWYAGWMERHDDETTPCQFHIITNVNDRPIQFETRDEAERECGYHAIARMYPDSHWLGENVN